MLKIPADLILLKGGVLVRWSTCLLYILFFLFLIPKWTFYCKPNGCHYILMQKYTSVQLEAKTTDLNQYMTSKSRGHRDNIKIFNQGKSKQIRENQGI